MTIVNSQNEQRLLTAILGLLIGFALIVSAFLFGTALIKSRIPPRYIEVKGFAERAVKADKGTWKLRFMVNDNLASTVLRNAEVQRQKLRDFALSKGFNAPEIEPIPIQLFDRFAVSYGGPKPEFRFQATSGIVVVTADVEKLISASQQIDEVVKEGVVLEEGSEPRFAFSALNNLKPDMLTEATQDGKKAASRFAADAGTSLGHLISAQQGFFSISARDSSEGERDDSEQSLSLMKKIRVVVSLKFAIQE